MSNKIDIIEAVKEQRVSKSQNIDKVATNCIDAFSELYVYLSINIKKNSFVVLFVKIIRQYFLTELSNIVVSRYIFATY